MGNCMAAKNGSPKENLNSSGKNFVPTERSASINNANSLVDDAHVDPKAKISNDLFQVAKDELAKMDLKHIRIRGIKHESKNEE